MKVKPVKLFPYYHYRRCETGVSFYDSFHGQKQIGHTVAPTMPRAYIFIDGDILSIRCYCDHEITVFPGCTREIWYQDRECEHEVFARIIYRASGLHELKLHNKTFFAIRHGQNYHFQENGISIACLEVQEDADTPSGYDRRCLKLIPLHFIPDEWALLFLNFPLLQIGF